MLGPVVVVIVGGILVAALVAESGECGEGAVAACRSQKLKSSDVIKVQFAVLDVAAVAADGYEDVMTRKKRETSRRQQRESPQSAVAKTGPSMETQRHLVPHPLHQHYPATASLATQSTFAE